MSGNDGRPGAWLPDAVMTRVRTDPVPSANRAFVAAVRRWAPVDAFTALATAWRLATLRSRPVPLVTRVRAAALALGMGAVLATSSAVALAGVANVARQVASLPSRTPQLEPARPAESPAGSLAPEPSAPPVLVITHGDGLERPHPRTVATATPTPTPERTAGPTTRPDQGGDSSGDDSGDSTPRPTVTPDGHDGSGDSGSDIRATTTPIASSSPTPQPSDSAPDGGSSSGDSASSGD